MHTCLNIQATAVTNVLDANAPKKRGKERETPKTKKPSPLKKVCHKNNTSNVNYFQAAIFIANSNCSAERNK